MRGSRRAVKLGRMSAMLRVVEGDITKLAVDAIVNAANSTLSGGSGVDGAIHRAAGPRLLDECRTLGGCATGDAKITQGYDLPARHVLHTVGPVWLGGNHGEEELLARCYRRCIALAAENHLRSVAFPAISTGAYRFPPQRAAAIAVASVRQSLARHPGVTEVTFVCFGPEAAQVYRALLGA